MPPEPMYPDRPVRPTGRHDWWRWNGHVINLRGREDHPKPVRAACLAVMDAATPEEQDAAAVLVWAVDEHPPWSGGCDSCGTTTPCDVLDQAAELAALFVLATSTDIVRRSRAAIARFDQKRAQK